MSKSKNKANKPIIVITGANGFVGTELVNHFSGMGWHVRALVRKPQTIPKKANVTYLAYDLGSKPDDAIFKDADYLVHTAYVKEDRNHPDAVNVNIEGTTKLLAASRKHKLQKNIFMSSMSAHEEAVSGYGKQKFAIEKLFNTPDDAVIRSGLVIGNGGLIKQIVTFMRSKHVAPLIDGGDQPLQVIGVYDLARVIEAILVDNHNGMFTIGTPEVYSYREFYLTVSRKLGIKVLIIPVPFWVPLLAIRTVNLLHLPLGVTEDNLWGLKKLKYFETLNDLAVLGVHLDTLEEILDKPDLIK